MDSYNRGGGGGVGVNFKINMSEKYTLNWYDAYKGLQMFVITAVVVSVGGVVMQTSFDVFTADWADIFRDTINVSVVSTFSYIIKNFLSNQYGEI